MLRYTNVNRIRRVGDGFSISVESSISRDDVTGSTLFKELESRREDLNDLREDDLNRVLRHESRIRGAGQRRVNDELSIVYDDDSGLESDRSVGRDLSFTIVIDDDDDDDDEMEEEEDDEESIGDVFQDKRIDQDEREESILGDVLQDKTIEDAREDIILGDVLQDKTIEDAREDIILGDALQDKAIDENRDEDIELYEYGNGNDGNDGNDGYEEYDDGGNDGYEEYNYDGGNDNDNENNILDQNVNQSVILLDEVERLSPPLQSVSPPTTTPQLPLAPSSPAYQPSPSPPPSPLPPQPPAKRRRAITRPVQRPTTSSNNNISKSITVKLHKVPTASGGTNRINGIDIISQIVLDLIEISVEKVESNALRESIALYHDTVAQEFYRLIDAVDLTRTLESELRKAETTRNNLRNRLVKLRQERVDVQSEIHKFRDNSSRNRSERSTLRQIGVFADKMNELPTLANPPPSSSTSTIINNNIQSQLNSIESTISPHYGSYDRIRLLNNRLQQLLTSSERT